MQTYPLVFLLTCAFLALTLIPVLFIMVRGRGRRLRYWKAEHYRRVGGLEKVQRGVAMWLEENGGVMQAHGTDGDYYTYKWRDQYYLIGLGVYGIDGEEVDFFTFLAHLAQE